MNSSANTAGTASRSKSRRSSLLKSVSSRYDLYLMLLIPIVWYLVFHYGPLYGLQIAFKNFSPAKGINGSAWVGLDHFKRFVESYYFWRLLWNTISINLFSLLFAFPIPILLALLVTEIRNKAFSKIVQNITYIPHFISIVVMVGMLMLFLSPRGGPVNAIIEAVGGEPVRFLDSAGWFKSILSAQISGKTWDGNQLFILQP